ncbi:hypothetical protein [uncultured Duncaniella sp.]|uniref:hypothetical protein n=1 Tax=uncultured Duncaniella sp. TaxID=2768039 RepID=UPI0025CD5131|nr:hypothetical protein [uncultured Duncaniella sp.]
MKIADKNGKMLRYGMLVPLALMIASVVSSCLSYSNAKTSIANDLNDAMIALVHENSELWTRQDTITALRKMHEATRKPLIYQASDLNFRNSVLKDQAYFTLALVDEKRTAPKLQGNKIASDSIMLVPERAVDGVAIQVQGFADCSMVSVFAASDQTLPSVLFALSILSMAGMFLLPRKVIGLPIALQETELPEMAGIPLHSTEHILDGIKLTPMQRRFARMLLEAPDMRVDKATLCSALWDNKSNAEESLYTLVRRTKTALAETDIEIICNRGESYELRVSG